VAVAAGVADAGLRVEAAALDSAKASPGAARE